VAGDTVANDMVDRDAAAVRIAAIAKRRRYGTAIQRQLADDIIDLACRHARLHYRHELIEDLGGQPTRLAHAGKAFGAMQLDRAVPQDGLAIDDVLILSHARHIATSAQFFDPAQREDYRDTVKAALNSGFTASRTSDVTGRVTSYSPST